MKKKRKPRPDPRQALSLRPARPVETMIRLVRGQKVILDDDLAQVYGVLVKALNQQVARNRDRFPQDFVFRLAPAEWDNLRSQFVTASWGGRRTPPLAFTEHGALMAASVLKSPRAAAMSVFVVRAFVRLREIIAANSEIAARVAELERRLKHHDVTLAEVVATLRRLTQTAPRPRRAIGFRREAPAQLKAWTAAARG